MFDPGITDLIKHMSQSPPAIVQFAQRAGGPAAADTERRVRAIEEWSADWITEAQRQFEAYRDTVKHDQDKSGSIASLDQAISSVENTIEVLTEEFRKQQKIARKLQSQVRSDFPLELDRFRLERTRVFKAIARAHTVRTDLLFALRALRCEIDPTAKDGPTFTDSTALGAYLRAAVA